MSLVYVCKASGQGLTSPPEKLRAVFARRGQFTGAVWLQGSADSFTLLTARKFADGLTKVQIRNAFLKLMNQNTGTVGTAVGARTFEIKEVRQLHCSLVASTAPAGRTTLLDDTSTMPAQAVAPSEPSAPGAQASSDDSSDSSAQEQPAPTGAENPQAQLPRSAPVSTDMAEAEVPEATGEDPEQYYEALVAKYSKELAAAKDSLRKCRLEKQATKEATTRKQAVKFAEQFRCSGKDFDAAELKRWFQPERYDPRVTVQATAAQVYGNVHLLRSGNEDLDPCVVFLGWKPTVLRNGAFHGQELLICVGRNDQDARECGPRMWLSSMAFPGSEGALRALGFDPKSAKAALEEYGYDKGCDKHGYGRGVLPLDLRVLKLKPAPQSPPVTEEVALP